MAYTRTYVESKKVQDVITSIRVGVIDIDVTFKDLGYLKVNKIMYPKMYSILEYMKKGMKVQLFIQNNTLVKVIAT